MTVNEDYFDAVLRHAVGVQRLTSGEVRRVLKLLTAADIELVKRIRKHLRGLAGQPLNVRGWQLKALVKDITVARKVLIAKLNGELETMLLELASTEVDQQKKIIAGVIPFEVKLAGVELAVLRAAVSTEPFAGGKYAARTLAQWFDDLEQVDQKRLVGAIQMGLAQGESINDVVKRVAGTRAGGFRDGVLAVSRRNAESIVRTAINHVSNSAREAVLLANADLFDGLRWTSTLDGRTTPICRSRDGKVAPVGGKAIPRYAQPLIPSGARPPAHPNCRSVMVAVLDIDGVAALAGSRPFVRDIRRPGRGMYKDFRAEAEAKAGGRWTRMTSSQRTAAAKVERLAWAQRVVGRVPAKTTYQEWLTRQPWSFQIDVLGPTRAKLFRDGGLTLDSFVDVRGKELTLAQLAKSNPAAFNRAGLDDWI